jgi:hypothetical protein
VTYLLTVPRMCVSQSVKFIHGSSAVERIDFLYNSGARHLLFIGLLFTLKMVIVFSSEPTANCHCCHIVQILRIIGCLVNNVSENVWKEAVSA